MDESGSLTRERSDDVPILMAHQEHMQGGTLLDRHVPTHGNGHDLCLGTVRVIWLRHLLSEGDHRLHHVEPWANQRLNRVQACLGQEMRSLDVREDRLATVQDSRSDDEPWQTLERDLRQHLIRVDDLDCSQV
jgi:hypothetical protein